jgi:hypothetical protein
MPAVVLVYLGLITSALGSISLLKPLAFLGIRSRPSGALVLVLGVAAVVVGFVLPSTEIRIAQGNTQLDQFVPVYQFDEFHSTKIHASQDRVYAAIKAVTADEILFFRTLTWIRRFGQPGPESIFNPSRHVPILEVATRTSFLLLAEDPEREVVVGTLALAPPGWRPPSRPMPQGFKELKSPGFALAGMNFLVQSRGPNECVLTTETRVYATDSSSRQKFALYWRVIYPGSALIRRMWLRAIRQRAEAATGTQSRRSQVGAPGAPVQ